MKSQNNAYGLQFRFMTANQAWTGAEMGGRIAFGALLLMYVSWSKY